MARSISEINENILNDISNTAELSTLNSNSKTAVYRLLTYIISVAIWVHENLWDQARTELETMVNYAIPGGIKWYRQKALEFQLGDSLQPLANFQVYTIIDESKKIIKYSSATESNGAVVIKVAKEDNGIPQALNNDEYSAFLAYMSEIKFAGTKLYVRSGSGAVLTIVANIYINPLYITANGQQVGNTSFKPVEDVIQNYLVNLTWDGIFYISSLVDAIQQVQGVVDVVIDSVSTVDNNQSVQIERIYEPYNGYFTISDFSGITYTPSYAVR